MKYQWKSEVLGTAVQLAGGLALILAAAVAAAPAPAEAAQFATLHQFSGDGSGEAPTGFLWLDTDGSVYGTASGYDAKHGSKGSVFTYQSGQFSYVGSGFQLPTALAVSNGEIYVTDVWKQELVRMDLTGHRKNLHYFAGGNGNYVTGSGDPNTFDPLSIDSAGNIIAVDVYAAVPNASCTLDGEHGTQCGAIFKIRPPATGTPPSYRLIGPLSGGATPILAGPVQADGTMTILTPPEFDSVSDIATPAILSLFSTTTNSFKTLHIFGSAFSGNCCSTPCSYVVRDGTGNYYGLMFGGPYPHGTEKLYRVASDGKETLLHDFDINAGTSCSDATTGLAIGPDGTVYGYMTSIHIPGENTPGFVWAYAPDGTFRHVYDFNGFSDSGLPFGQILVSSTGTLYGSAVNYFAGSSILWSLTP